MPATPPPDPFRRAARALVLALALLGPAACVVAPYPVEYAPASFERSWNAASGALVDAGLALASQDRASGTAVGVRGNVEVVASVRPQGDGSVRVEFTVRRGANEDPGVVTRVTDAYQRRMGR